MKNEKYIKAEQSLNANILTELERARHLRKLSQPDLGRGISSLHTYMTFLAHHRNHPASGMRLSTLFAYANLLKMRVTYSLVPLTEEE